MRAAIWLFDAELRLSYNAQTPGERFWFPEGARGQSLASTIATSSAVSPYNS